jgi:inosose dehydratase
MSLWACQEWPWVCYWRAQGKELRENLEVSMTLCREVGFNGWEGSLPEREADLRTVVAALSNAGLGFRSFYANARLHDANTDAVVDGILERCSRAVGAGMGILTLNPEPIDWGNPFEKNDVELERQAKALKRLDEELGKIKVTLAYHIHDSEMRSDSREFLAMLKNLPDLKLCLECEWLKRGGWDNTRILDFVRRNASRYAISHLRQSKGGQPQLTFGEGDIDYAGVADIVRSSGFDGPFIFEGYRDAMTQESEMKSALSVSLEQMRRFFAAA